jgi:hypothetical protein
VAEQDLDEGGGAGGEPADAGGVAGLVLEGAVVLDSRAMMRRGPRAIVTAWNGLGGATTEGSEAMGHR